MVIEDNHSLPEENHSNTFEGMTDDEIHELVQVFIEDATEQLEKLNAILLSLEKGEYSPDDIHNLYRIFHSFKGSAASFGFKEISQVSHQLEDILAPVRNGQVRITDSLTSLLFDSLDQFRFVFQNIQQNKPYADIISSLSEVIEKYVITPQPMVREAESPFPFIPAVPQELNYEVSLREESIRIKLQKINRLIDLSSEMAVRKNYGQVNIPKIMSLLEKVQEKENEITSFIRERGSENKVNYNLYPTHKYYLEMLEFTGDISSGLKILLDDFSRWFFQLNILAEELRYEALMTRMFPLSITITQMKRVVRDLAKVLNKNATLEVIGEDTEIDRRILEELKDPLIHILRNAVDHGIESPEIRTQIGKPPVGVITIHASQTGNAIILDISDDGAGIDENSINLIFMPGFSTSKDVSEVSGRGVGLDVVQNNVKRLHGQIKVSSQKGKGTTFHIRIPSTLTIASVLIFDVGSFIFALDTLVITKTILLSSAEVKGSIDNLVLKYQGRDYPVVKFRDYLKIPANGKSNSNYPIALINFDGRCIGLLVDSFLDHQEIIIRPLQMALEEAQYFSGVTFLPDGTSAFILAPDALLNDVKKVRKISMETSEFAIELESMHTEEKSKGLQISLVLLKIGNDIISIPAHWVLRKFLIPRQPVKSPASRRSLVFGNKKIPLINMRECLGINEESDSEQMTAIICSINDRLLALEIDEIVSKDKGWINYDKSSQVKKGSMKASLKDGRELLMIHEGLLFPYLPREMSTLSDYSTVRVAEYKDTEQVDFIGKQEKDTRLITFSIGNVHLGIPFQVVQEIVPSAEIFRFDGNLSNPRGFINLRGECVEIFNLCTLFPEMLDIPLSDYIVVVVQCDPVKRGIVVQHITTEMELLSGQSPLQLPPEISPLFPPIYQLSSKSESTTIKMQRGV